MWIPNGFHVPVGVDFFHIPFALLVDDSESALEEGDRGSTNNRRQNQPGLTRSDHSHLTIWQVPGIG